MHLSSQGTPAINIQALMEIMDNDLALIQDCFADFLADLPGFLEEIQDAVAQKDPGKLTEAAHKLKGTLKYLAAEPAAQAALALESAGRNQDLENLDRKRLTLENECKGLAAFITDFHPPC